MGKMIGKSAFESAGPGPGPRVEASIDCRGSVTYSAKKLFPEVFEANRGHSMLFCVIVRENYVSNKWFTAVTDFRKED
jgi:hypothetical protein